jgi:hypothetical protein
MKLFISYSSRDRDAVKNLAQDLESAVKTLPHQSEFGVWFDQELIGGHDWWNNIVSAVYHSDLFIFALTPDSLESTPCKLEYTYASRLNKRVLPVLLSDGVNPSLLPDELQRLQFVDYRTDDKTSYQRLLAAIANLPAPQPPPDPLPTPPDAPVSPLAQIKAQLEAPSLDLDTQLKLVFQLKQYLSEADKTAGARELLQQLSHHPDVRAAIAQDIAVILGNTPPPAPVTRPPEQERRAPSVNIVRPAQAGSVSAKPAGQRSGSRPVPILIGAGLGILFALIGVPNALNEISYCSFNIYCTEDYATGLVIGLCLSFVLWPGLGAAAGWAYTRFINRPKSS